MKRLTIKEIAKMAGVSMTAVSFVLNNKPGVSDETREHIQRIIDETGFRPNLNSKKLLFNKSFHVCIMINPNASPFEDLFYFEVMRGILNKSRAYGYNITIDEPICDGNELPDAIYTGDTDGMIFMQDISDTLTEKAIASGIPFVIVDSHSLTDRVTSINPDYCGAAYTAASYLLELGHRDIAIISSNVVDTFQAQTLLGYTNAMNERGLTPAPEYVEHSVSNETGAYKAAKILFTRDNRPSALLCTVDTFAVGALHCAKDLGLRVPQDVSIVGIDDILLARYMEPKLTTVGIDKVHMGELAMDLLLQKIQGETPDSISLPMELVVRDSARQL